MSSKSAEFSRRVAQLQECLDKECGNAGTKSKCVPTMLITGAVVPIVLWALLYFIQPRFVQKHDEDGHSERDTKKVFMYTVILTALVWAAMYGYSVYRGARNISMTCAM
jgi:hypothetical protein